MFRPRVIPVLLLRGRGVVKTVKFKDATYIGDPINSVKLFNDMFADELIFLDITATSEKRTVKLDLIKDIAEEAYMPFAVGGGIAKLENAVELFNSGAEKVVINTASVINPNLIGEIAGIYGKQSVVVSIDVKKNLWGKTRVHIQSGKKSTDLDPVKHAVEMVKLGAGEIMFNSIDRDGTMNGMDLELIREISSAIEVPLIGCGGAGNLEHIKLAIKAGASAGAAGSIFVYHGSRKGILINYPSRKELEQILKQDEF